MSLWVFSSRNLENIRIAKDRLLWGFWDREMGERMRRNWRPFIRLYNRIKPFDIVVFQIAGTGEIHAIGIVEDKHYDDQTPVWPEEIGRNKVLFPWRVSFSSIIFSEEPFTVHSVRIENYIDGYGIGELPRHEFETVKNKIQEKLGVELKIDLG
ncbi:MAG: hypothetical protein ACK4H7_03420 [Acidilobaceae archaeon]